MPDELQELLAALPRDIDEAGLTALLAQLDPRQVRSLYTGAARDHMAAYVVSLGLGIVPARHHMLLIEHLEAIERGDIDRLMVNMPPGSAKSTYASVLFPAWYLGRGENRSVLAASNNHELAADFGHRVRNLFGSSEHRGIFGFSLAPDKQAADNWQTERGGVYFAAGVGSAIAGRRADLGLIDDPVKSREEADSDRVREKTWQWYLNDFKPRLKPGASQVVIMTRWHEADLGGRLLESEAERWKVVKLPMVAESGDALGRLPGERLWPEWFTEQMVEDAKRDVRVWTSLFQQEPTAQDGDYFKRDWFQEDEAPPAKLAIYGASDYAVTEGGGDATEHGIFGIDAWANIHIIDWWRGHTTADTWIEAQADMIVRHQPMCWFGEAGPIRRAIEPFLLRRLEERRAFCRLEWLPSTADKPTRCRAFQALAASGKVFVPARASWKADVIGQLLRFPAGLHDDAVDVCSLLGRGLEHIRVPELVERQMQTRAHVGYGRAKRYG